MWRKVVIGGMVLTAAALIVFVTVSHVQSLRWDRSFGRLHFIELEAYKGELAIRYGSYFTAPPGEPSESDTSGVTGWITFRNSLVVNAPYDFDLPPAGEQWYRRVGTLMLNMWLLLALAGTIPLAWVASRRALRHHRQAHHQCPQCGYDLRGNVSGACPECGRHAQNAVQSRDQ